MSIQSWCLPPSARGIAHFFWQCPIERSASLSSSQWHQIYSAAARAVAGQRVTINHGAKATEGIQQMWHLLEIPDSQREYVFEHLEALTEQYRSAVLSHHVFLFVVDSLRNGRGSMRTLFVLNDMLNQMGMSQGDRTSLMGQACDAIRLELGNAQTMEVDSHDESMGTGASNLSDRDSVELSEDHKEEEEPSLSSHSSDA